MYYRNATIIFSILLCCKYIERLGVFVEQKVTKKEILFSFKQTIPVLLGYIFLGIAFGLLMSDSGYGLLLSGLCSVFIYAGSMQFVLAGLFLEKAGLITVALMTIFVNGRHIFYGLSFIDKYKKQGKRYPYLVAALTDETYSVLCNLNVSLNMSDASVEKYSNDLNKDGTTGTEKIYPGKDVISEDNCIFLITLLNHSYWVIGTLIGALVGTLITFDTTGIDFSMTALFTVIVVNQWLEMKNHFPAICGAIIGVICLLILGPDKFLLPALFLSACILAMGRRFKFSRE